MTQRVIGLCGRKGAGKDTVAAILVRKGWKRIAFADPLYEECAAAFGVTTAFLNKRETKETPLPNLQLRYSQDPDYVAAVLMHLLPRSVRKRIRQSDNSHPKFMKGVRRRTKKELTKHRSPRVLLQWWGTEYRRAQDKQYFLKKLASNIRAEPEVNFVITDVRFMNEVEFSVSEFNATMARVSRPWLEAQMDETMLHPSEQELMNYQPPVVFLNEEGPQGLANLEKQVLKELNP